MKSIEVFAPLKVIEFEAVAEVVTVTRVASRIPVVIFPASIFAITRFPIGAVVQEVPPAPAH